jgi:hypothetical protein
MQRVSEYVREILPDGHLYVPEKANLAVILTSYP